MVIAYHLIWTAYGWWLPNDPRGSMSQVIRNDVIAELGELHYGRKRVQPASREVRAFLNEAKSTLTHAMLRLSDVDVAAVADAFARVVAGARYTCYACAIMPDHVHILIRKHRDLANEMIANLQRESHLELRSRGLRDLEHPVWGGKGWKVFLDSPEEVRRTVGYVEQNLVKLRLSRQHWDFVLPYDGWTFRQ